MENKENKVPTITNWIDWLVYTIAMYIFTIPFFDFLSWEHFCVSVIGGFFAGLLNRIIRELVFIKNKP